jgi:transposase InsO family protein
MKYAWMEAHEGLFGLSELCGTLGVSVSGYRAWVRGGVANRKGLTDEQLLALIQAIHTECKGAYGSPRRVRERRGRGVPARKGRVERRMGENGIRARHQRRYKATTDSKHGLPVADNRLGREFQPSAPNQVWTADITALWTEDGGLYLAIVLDLFNRAVIGWSIQSHMKAPLVIDALTMAWFRRQPGPGVMLHSDQGSQYASRAFQDRLKEYGMMGSMSRKGHCWDNAPTESGFGTFKNERVQGIRLRSHTEVKDMIFEYIEIFYNRKRLHSSLGYQSPVRCLEQWLKRQLPEKRVA